jgi:hypothetical protein
VPYGSAQKSKKDDEPKSVKKAVRRAMRFDEMDASTAQTPRQMREAIANARRARKVVKKAQPTARQRRQAASIATRRAARGGY